MPIANKSLIGNEVQAVKAFDDKNAIYIAQVMDTRSPKGNGDIKVWVLGTANDKNRPENWVVAHSINDINNSLITDTMRTDDTENGQIPNGEWKPKPFVGNYVFIFYPETQDNNLEPYYFGSIQGSVEHSMIPGIPYNLNDKEDYTPICDKNGDEMQCEFSPLARALSQQGLLEDKLRGTSTASSIRDVPSHCWGYLSPLGNSFVVDDGWSLGDSNINWENDPRKDSKDNDNRDDFGEYFAKQNWFASLNENDVENKLNRFHGGFRFRTRNGTQLLILDSGNIYAINQDGSAWMELSEDGYIDCYSQKGINASSEGDINLHSEKNINIEAKGKINMKATTYSIEADGNVNMKCGSLVVANQVITRDLQANSGNIGQLQSMNANVNGTFQGTLQGTAYFATNAGFIPVQQPIPQVKNVLVDSPVITSLNQVGQYDGLKISSITTRCPSHEPWDDHNKNDVIPDLDMSQKKQEIKKPQLNIPTQTNQIRQQDTTNGRRNTETIFKSKQY